MTLYLGQDQDAQQEMARKMNSAKDKDFWHNVRKYFREFNETTGIHGLRYVTEKRSRVEKVVWTLFLLLSLAGCIYMIYEILEKYNNSPVVVSFATQDTPIFQIPFPAVSICPESKYSGELFNYSDVSLKINAGENVDGTRLKTFYHLSLLCDDDGSSEKTANGTVGEDFYATIDEATVTHQSVEPAAIHASKMQKVKELEAKMKGVDFCDCKPSCTNLKFNVETSHSDFYFEQFFKMRFGKEEIEEKYANAYWSVLQVYFKDEQFMTKERNELYGVSDLISQLGGLLGLFTGFSLVTAVEIIYFCSLRIYYNERLYGLWSGPPS